MTLDQKKEARDNAWRAMEAAQLIVDDQNTLFRDREIALAVYEAHWALYLLLTEDVKKEQKNAGTS